MPSFKQDIVTWDLIVQDYRRIPQSSLNASWQSRSVLSSELFPERSPSPVSKDAVANSPEVKIESGETKQCPICLKEFETGSKAKSMPCHHVFHQDCIVLWLEEANTCPLCRYQLSSC